MRLAQPHASTRRCRKDGWRRRPDARRGTVDSMPRPAGRDGHGSGVHRHHGERRGVVRDLAARHALRLENTLAPDGSSSMFAGIHSSLRRGHARAEPGRRRTPADVKSRAPDERVQQPLSSAAGSSVRPPCTGPGCTTVLRGARRKPNRVLWSSVPRGSPYAVAREPTPKSTCASPRHTGSTAASAWRTASMSTLGVQRPQPLLVDLRRRAQEVLGLAVQHHADVDELLALDARDAAQHDVLVALHAHLLRSGATRGRVRRAGPEVGDVALAAARPGDSAPGTGSSHSSGTSASTASSASRRDVAPRAPRPAPRPRRRSRRRMCSLTS